MLGVVLAVNLRMLGVMKNVSFVALHKLLPWGILGFGINVFTGITEPWSLVVAGFMSFPLLRSYARLWQAGYSWRDVLHRPPAPDAIPVPVSRTASMVVLPSRLSATSTCPPAGV